VTVQAAPAARRDEARWAGDDRPVQIVSYVLMALTVLVTIYPLVWMFLGAFKSENEFYTNIWGLPGTWVAQNFVDAFNLGGLGWKYLNSIVVTGGTLLVVIPLTSMTAYAIVTMDFPGRRLVYVYLLFGIMVPFGVTAIPIFVVVNSLGLLSTQLGLVLVYAAQSLSFGTFLMVAFFQSLPREIEEAALVDGCTRFGAFVRVILPLARPGIATQVVFVGLTVWNEYFMASLLIHNEALQTLPLGLVTFTGRYSTNYPQLFAALTITTIPVIVVYLLAQRQFMSGLTAGAVKG
jgi:ABC-type glycerol-3-phosphate transport system permease component